MNPLSTMGTKQMCVSNPDGVIPMLQRYRGRGDRGSGKKKVMKREKGHQIKGDTCDVVVHENRRDELQCCQSLHHVRQELNST